MLVLSRRNNEEIVIDNNIRIRVIETVGGKVRLGIEAPRHVVIRRAEIEFRDDPALVAAGPGEDGSLPATPVRPR